MYNKVEYLSAEMVGMRADIKELTMAVNRLEGGKIITYAE
jgi:hypothetical protein